MKKEEVHLLLDLLNVEMKSIDSLLKSHENKEKILEHDELNFHMEKWKICVGTSIYLNKLNNSFE